MRISPSQRKALLRRVAIRIAYFRELRGQTDEGLATCCRCSSRTWSRRMADPASITLGELISVASLLNVSVSELMGGGDIG